MGTVAFIYRNVVVPVVQLIGLIVGGTIIAALCVYVFGKTVGAF